MSDKITKEDAALLRDILKYWASLSDCSADQREQFAIDHFHNGNDLGGELSDKLERLIDKLESNENS